MKANALPDTIQTIIQQAGGFRLNGAFAYIGASGFSFRCAAPLGEYRARYVSKLATEAGRDFVDYEVGLQCRVNGKRGHRWTLIIAYEPDDTYSVWLIAIPPERRPSCVILACRRHVYGDTLKAVVEQVYDRAIQTHNGGFIPLD